ncbi:MAG: hypothetical protein J6R60_00030 [Clostridia bacterium]|nr:hypothetical protein [Clostridia bacterium]
MTKKKKIILGTIAGLCIAAVISVAAYGMILYLDYIGTSFTVNDTLPNGQGTTARVILLGGQSNAAGCSRDEYLQKNVSSEKYEEYQNGYDNVYINYFVSDNNISNGFVKCGAMQGETGGFFGPELGMAEALSKKYPNEKIFIIKYTWSGTDLFSLWLSPSSKGKTGDLYQAFVRFTQTSIKYLESKDYNVVIEGMCWMQGESDSFSTENATNYEKHLSNFIKDVRKTFKRYASKDGIAFVDAYIADNPVYWVYCDLVNESKRRVSQESEINVVVDTVEQGLSCSAEPEEAPDLAHYDSMSEIKLGHLFAEEIQKFFD